MSDAAPLELVWNIKTSFIAYINRMADGRIAVGDGATQDADGFHFPLRSRSETLLEFDGAVEFSGHFGMLFVPVSELRLDVSGEQAVLSIADDVTRLDFATGVFDGSTLEPLALTEDGADLFFEVYRTGEALDPARLVARSSL